MVRSPKEHDMSWRREIWANKNLYLFGRARKMTWFGRARKQIGLCTQGNKNCYGRTYKMEWLGRAKTNKIMFAARKENEMVWTRKIWGDMGARKNNSG